MQAARADRIVVLSRRRHGIETWIGLALDSRGRPVATARALSSAGVRSALLLQLTKGIKC